MTKTADVVLGNQITVPWGNEIRDRTIQIVASTTERDSAFPGPVDGQMVYVNSGDALEGLQVWNGTSWRPGSWNQPWGVVPNGFQQVSVNQTGITASVDLISAFSWTPVANRRYRVDYQCRVGGTVAGDLLLLNVTDLGPTFNYSVTVSVPPNHYMVQALGIFFTTASLGSSPLTWKLAGQRSAGTGTVDFQSNIASQCSVVITDIGPLGAPA